METTRHQPHPGPLSAAGPEENGGSQIAQFYQDQVVFLTGGTGFVGKVLLEKLLRSCPGVKEVYLLVRGKKGKEPEARTEAMLKSKVFERLNQEQPGALRKVKAVAGDLTQLDLGLTSTDQATLFKRVSVVFHSAATVKFDEPLKRAVDLNVLGTRRVVDLCKKMPNLRALVHISTAYCNCDKPEVDEVVYTPPIDPSKIIEAAEWMDDKMMDMMSGLLLGQLPNTYTLTKALAESLVLAERETVPVAIVRPSIVTASWKEPFPGWVDNLNGGTGMAVSLGLGLLSSLLVEKDCVLDVIPVDVVANTLIAVAWHTATTRFLPLYRKARRGMDAILYFSTHGWLFRSNNVVALIDYLSPADKQIFDFDIRDVQWFPYWNQYMMGIRKYLFEADVSSLPQSRKRMKWLYIVHLLLNLLPVMLVGRLLITQSQMARNLCGTAITFPNKLRSVLPALPSLPWRR
ncbi:putative fatty acyl-CoA reductase CG5065 isoform X2 [Haemaphysalis longicornis]